MLIVITAGCAEAAPLDNVGVCRPLSAALFFTPKESSSREALEVFIGQTKRRKKHINKNASLSERSLLFSNLDCAEVLDEVSLTELLAAENKLDKSVVKLLKTEIQLEHGIRVRDVRAVKSLLSKIGNEIKTRQDFENLLDIQPTADLLFLNNIDDFRNFHFLNIYHYYSARLAILEEDHSKSVESFLSLYKLNTNYSYKSSLSHIFVSHDMSDYFRTAFTNSSFMLMDISQILSQSSYSYELTPSQQVSVHVLAVRQIAFSFMSTKVLPPYDTVLSSYNLSLKKEKAKHQNLEDFDSLTETVFDVGYSKFRNVFPYDKGPYAWKYASQLRRKHEDNKKIRSSTCLTDVLVNSFDNKINKKTCNESIR